jgi:hypothetical protein
MTIARSGATSAFVSAARRSWRAGVTAILVAVVAGCAGDSTPPTGFRTLPPTTP